MSTTVSSTSPVRAERTPAYVRRRRLLTLLQHQGALIALIAACIFGFARYSTFLTPENLLNVLRQNSMVGLVALGMTFVILTGGIDLSVGALLAAAGVVAGALSPRGTLIAIAGGVGTAAVLGMLNGLVIAKARIQPFVVTLAMMIAARGVALAATREQSVRVATEATGLTWLGRGWVGPIPVPVLLLILLFTLGWVVLRYTTFGRHVYAVGDEEGAARLLGLNVDRVIIATYALSGALAGLAGVVLASRLGAGQPVAGMGWELDAIAAVVVGGTVLTGGQGGAGLTLTGVVLLGVILNLLNLEGTLSPWWQWVIRGGFLLAVVVVQARMQHKVEGE
jgi:ribose/xylose/arabinose/galactoside ABC-type transport system permease subunit